MKRNVIAFYMRLSNEDRDIGCYNYKTESNSITNQRILLYDFVKSHEEFDGCEIIEKCDDGFSGIHFENRPQLQELMELVKKGSVQTIIVKDFSRFGRNYIELGDYLEHIFPLLGVRFISVNDNYDSSTHKDSTGGLDMAFKNLIYDFYSREQSKKVRLAWKKMAEKGQYWGRSAPYGYSKDPDNPHCLRVHPENSKVVERIFNMAVSGVSLYRIAQILNDSGLLSPAEYHKSANDTNAHWGMADRTSCWEGSTINRIIRDERYTGTMVALKTEVIGVRGKHTKRKKEEWIRVENTHEAIVSYETYLKANEMISGKKSSGRRRQKINIYHCGYCGRKLKKYTESGIMVCPQRNRISECECSKAHMRKSEMDRIVLEALNVQIEYFLAKENLSDKTAETSTVLSAGKEIKSIEGTLKVMEKSWMMLYDRYSDGEITREEYIKEKKKYNPDKERLEEKLEILKKQAEKSGESRDRREEMSAIMKAGYMQTELTEDIKDNLIKRVNVFSDERIEIEWKFEKVV